MTAFNRLPKPAPGCQGSASLLTVLGGGWNQYAHFSHVMPGNPTSILSCFTSTLHPIQHFQRAGLLCLFVFVWLVLFLFNQVTSFWPWSWLSAYASDAEVSSACSWPWYRPRAHLYLREVTMMQLDPLWQWGGRHRAGCVFL